MPNIKGALAALQAYVNDSGDAELHEPQDLQASDLITDLLHLFSEREMRNILRRAQRDWPEEREQVHYIGQDVKRVDYENNGTPAFPGVIERITVEDGEVTYWINWDGAAAADPHKEYAFRTI